MKTSTKILLGAIFLAVLSLRLYFSFQTTQFSSDEAYFNIRHTDYITENVKPLFFDSLSYSGRYVLDLHLFHYLLAAFKLILPGMLAYKLIPEIILAALVFLVFAIAKEITGNETAALFSALMAGFTPVLFSTTLNQVSSLSLVFFLLLYVVYAFFELRRNVNLFIILALLLPLVHPIGFVFAFSMIVYLLLSGLESIPVDSISKESIILVLFFDLLAAFVIYKDAFISTGLGAVWQNVPQELLANYFKGINLLEIITGIGILPIIFGAIGLIFALKAKKKSIYVLSAFLLTDFVLLSMKMIDFNTGLLLLGLMLTIISAISFDKFIVYINMTKFLKFKRLIGASLLMLILLSSTLPSFITASNTIKGTLTDNDLEAFRWIELNTPEDSVVLAGIDEGNYITALAKRKNVADSFFLLAPNRYPDMEKLFKTQSLVEALDIIKKYDINYIYLSERTKKSYAIDELVYARDENCFQKVLHNEQAEINKVLC